MFPIAKGQIVVVEWLDICSDSRWLDAQEQSEFKPTRALAVGFVAYQDDTMLKLAHNVCVDDGKSDMTVYPIGVIQKVTVLADGKA